jgi:hypothetical protein
MKTLSGWSDHEGLRTQRKSLSRDGLQSADRSLMVPLVTLNEDAVAERILTDGPFEEACRAC